MWILAQSPVSEARSRLLYHYLLGISSALSTNAYFMRRLQLRFDFDSTAVRLLIEGH